MRIAFFVKKFPKLSETFILNQITGMLDLGHDVDIYGSAPSSPEPSHFQVASYNLLQRTIRLQPPPRGFLQRLLKISAGFVTTAERRPALLKAISFRHRGSIASLCCTGLSLPLVRKYDVIHCHFGPTGDMAVRLRDVGLLPGPIITTFHGYDVNVLPRQRGNDMYRYLFFEGDLFTVSSEFIRKRLVELGAPEHKIVRHAVGIDTAAFSRMPQTNHVPTLVTVGRLVEVKGVEYGIRAVASLSEKIPDIRYLVVGDGLLKGQLEKLAGDLGVSRNVLFLGHKTQAELAELYAQADVFILPGVVAADGAEEGQGMVLLEAQAAGIAVVASRIGGIPESVLDGRSGFLVPSRNVDELAQKIALLLQDSSMRREMGVHGKRYVEEHFDIHRLNTHLQDIYARISRDYFRNTQAF